ncbi:MAG: hypothetical protein JWM27_494 [Gemmatimonadetes bacterium]|nr:hypothetical protein [Gemmatimonadota bacterium]
METIRSVDALTRHNVEMIARLQAAGNQERTTGESVADAVARVVGSWPFIIVQSVLLLVWMALNALAWVRHWDPYPFILLNLALSFQAAYASPIIMMSQNRQAKLGDLRNLLDLQINLLAEQESTETLRLLRILCEKQGVDVDREGSLRALEQATQPENLIKQIEHAEARHSGKEEPASSGTAGPAGDAPDGADGTEDGASAGDDRGPDPAD